MTSFLFSLTGIPGMFSISAKSAQQNYTKLYYKQNKIKNNFFNKILVY